MAISYNKLWHILVDRGMTKTNLVNVANISWSSIAKLNKNENINTVVLEKICTALNCDVSDIMEIKNNKD